MPANPNPPSTDLRDRRFPRKQAAAFALFMIPAFAVALWLGNVEFLFYAVVTAVLALLVWFMHARVGFTGALLWLLVLWAFLHMVGGLVPVPGWLPAKEPRVFYNLWLTPPGNLPVYLKYDQVIHAFGFGVTAWAVWQALRSRFAGVRPTLGLLLIVWTSAQGFGALNEIVEFTAVLLVEETNVGDFHNAMWDLVANATGALIACLLIRLTGGKN